MQEVDLYLRKFKVVRTADPRDLLSVEAQESTGRAWAAREGLQVRKVWVDNLSAWSDVVRPEFDNALAAVMNGEVPCLWNFAMDRFTRKGIDEIGPVLGKARVIFDYEGLDSSIERDRRWIIDRAEQAREFSQRLSYNVKSTKARQRETGRWSGRAPYGLVAGKDRKLRHGEMWPIVERIITDLAGGTTRGETECVPARSLARALTHEGIASPGGGPWRPGAVIAIARNPVYLGWMPVPGDSNRYQPREYRNAAGERVRVIADECAPLPEELVMRARAALAGHGTGGPRIGRAHHTLTGLSGCTGCLGPMQVGGQYYRCSRYAAGLFCPSPALVSITALEGYIFESWGEMLGNARPDDPLVLAVAQRWGALTNPQDAAASAAAREQIAMAEAAVRQLADDRAAGLYAGEMGKHFPRLVHEAEARLEAARDRLNGLSATHVDVGFLIGEPENATRFILDADPETRRELLPLAIDKIWVSKGRQGYRFDGEKRVRIEWAVPIPVAA
ncbi:recombinase family protein [Kitasatospora sp. NPDC057542]|uniref:recombinase family protein n=1 Tax=Kitasatospora sp. NPDC057542 TaxID=3346162 RepID=UPI003689A7FD